MGLELGMPLGRGLTVGASGPDMLEPFSFLTLELELLLLSREVALAIMASIILIPPRDFDLVLFLVLLVELNMGKSSDSGIDILVALPLLLESSKSLLAFIVPLDLPLRKRRVDFLDFFSLLDFSTLLLVELPLSMLSKLSNSEGVLFLPLRARRRPRVDFLDFFFDFLLDSLRLLLIEVPVSMLSKLSIEVLLELDMLL